MEAESSSQKPHMQMAASRFSVSSCPSLLMAFLFALSAFFQFNDPDWYFWFPLYAMACLINVVNGVPEVTKTARIALLMGIILFLKVVIEDVRFHQGITGVWSFDMRERVVREKLGSGLVILSMSLQLLKSDTDNPNHVEFGQAMLVAIGYGLSVAFFFFLKPEMKF